MRKSTVCFFFQALSYFFTFTEAFKKSEIRMGLERGNVYIYIFMFNFYK